MGYDDLSDKDKSILMENYTEFYEEIPLPQKGDWLWDHKETGQSYKSLITGITNQPSFSHNTIYIKNLDEGMEGSFLTKEIIEHLRTLLEIYYVAPKVKIISDNYNFDTLKIPNRENYYLQYHAGKTIEILSKLIPKDGLLIIGFTAFDIYPRDEWNFVFGLADKMSGCGVFSLCRYYDEIFSSNLDKEKGFLIRTVTKLAGKIMNHEVGHLFGLNHCIYFKCVMNGSNHMQENLTKPFDFCPVCLRKIWGNLKFDLVERFIQIPKCLEKIDNQLYKEEIDWYNKRYSSIKELQNKK